MSYYIYKDDQPAGEIVIQVAGREQTKDNSTQVVIYECSKWKVTKNSESNATRTVVECTLSAIHAG